MTRRSKTANQGLWKALATDRPELIDACIQKGADINCKNHKGNTPLSESIECGYSLHMIKKLLAHKANTSAIDTNGQTILHKSILLPDAEILQEILMQKNSKKIINTPNQHGITPLFYAITQKSDPNIASSLIDAGANCEAKNGWLYKTFRGIKNLFKIESHTLDYYIYRCNDYIVNGIKKLMGYPINPQENYLHIAARCSNADMVKMLLDHNLDIGTRDEHGHTPLHVAIIEANNVEIAQILLSKVNLLNNRTMQYIMSHKDDYLHDAIRHASSDMVQLLIDMGANIATTDANNITPLYSAIVESNNPSILKALTDTNAKYKAQYGKDIINIHAQDASGFTPLYLAIVKAKSAAMLQILVDADVDIHANDNTGYTPLYLAIIEAQSPELLKTLIDSKVNIHTKDDSGFSPLYLAIAKAKSPELVKVLINAGIDIDSKDNSGFTLLDLAIIKSDNIKIVQLLAEHGCDITACDKSGQTYLHKAAMYHSSAAMIAALIKLGVDINAKDSYGFTPLHKACRADVDLPTIKHMIQLGADVNSKDHDGLTPLSYAVNNNINKDMVNFLVKNKATVTEPMVESAKHGGNQDILKILKNGPISDDYYYLTHNNNHHLPTYKLPGGEYNDEVMLIVKNTDFACKHQHDDMNVFHNHDGCSANYNDHSLASDYSTTPPSSDMNWQDCI